MSLLVQRPDVGEFRQRFKWLTLVVVLLMSTLIGRAVHLQVIQGEDLQALAKENIIRKVTLKTTRGVIRDRNGEVLARSRPAYNLFVAPTAMTALDKTKKAVLTDNWRVLVNYAGFSSGELSKFEERLLQIRRQGGTRLDQQILLKEDLVREVVAVLRTHAREMKGVNVVPVSVRFYPEGRTGAHILGYMREVDAEMLVKLRKKKYLSGDRIGATGLERSWESYLRGSRGQEKIIVDARGRRQPEREGIIDEPRRIEPIPGRDLRLTIDVDVQRAMVKAMRGELAGGAALVDIRTGRILGLVSKPGFDPNQLSGGQGKQVIRDAFRRLFSDPLKPALDKTVSGAYPPGSTFKPLTALAALEKGLINPRVSTVCRGFVRVGRRIFRCTQQHGPTNLRKGIAQSCNVYFYRLVTDYGVTMDMIADTGMRYGFGKKTGLGVNAETSGRMPTRAWMTMRNKGQFRLGFTLNAALGQGATTVSVLQLSLAYAALANGGTLFQPQLVKAVETARGEVVQEFSPRVRRRIKLDGTHRKLIDSALRAATTEERGTAFKARIEGVSVSGKTGSAQVSHKTRGAEVEDVWYFNRDHAWFAGYAPSDTPEVAVVVLIEHGGAGGKHAAPVAFEIIRAYQRIRKQQKAEETAPDPRRPLP